MNEGICKTCVSNGRCFYVSKPGVPVVNCPRYKHKRTHADEVRAMNDEELANFLCDTSETCAGCIAADFCKYGKIGFVEWLKQPVEGEEYKL